MEFYWITDIEVWSADGRIVSPFPFEASIDNIVGSVHTDARGTQVTAEASREDEHMTAELVYRPEKTSPGGPVGPRPLRPSGAGQRRDSV